MSTPDFFVRGSPRLSMWQWWVSRYGITVINVASPNTLDHSARARLVAIITLVCSYSLVSK